MAEQRSEAEVVVDRVERKRKITIHVSVTPVVEVVDFLPILPDIIEATLNEADEIIYLLLKGVVPKKDGGRSARLNKVWFYKRDYKKNAPAWLQGLVVREAGKESR